MKIGGFFPLQPPASPPASSVFALWALDRMPSVAYHNGRSALHYTVRMLKAATLWLPSYCCDSLAVAALHSGAQLRYYPVDDALSPDVNILAAQIRAGDAVLAIDYFGHVPSTAFLQLVTRRHDIHWIEDRAQAFYPAPEPWGDYILYSPRKLLGVGDGGIMVSDKGPLPEGPPAPAPDAAADHPARMRAADRYEKNNAVWHDANRRFEAAQGVENIGMSALSLELLKRADATMIMQRRRENFHFLLHHLGAWAILPDMDDCVPLGFPIHVPQRAALAAYLAQHGVFAAHHWPHLPAPADAFAKTHRFAAQCLTLPCDQRYTTDDMRRIVTLIEQYP